MAKAPESKNSSGNRANAFILRIKKSIEEKVEVVVAPKIGVSIFPVPKSLSAIKPLAYKPQLLGLGPFHHCHPGLVGMETYKLAAVSRASNKLFANHVELKQLVKKLIDLRIDHQVRLSYHDKLEGMTDETVVWIMAIDGMFLLEFIKNYVDIERQSRNATMTAHLIDSSGNKLAHHSILADIMMLENQIPMFVLKEILSIQCSSDDDDEQTKQQWAADLIRFCKIVAPLKLRTSQEVRVFDSHHLLDLLYRLAVTSSNASNNQKRRNAESALDSSTTEPTPGSGQRPRLLNVSINVWVFIRRLWKAIVNTGCVRKVTNAIALKNKEGTIPDQETLWDIGENKMALVDEMLIPPVSELIYAGVEFEPADNISGIRFDKKTRTFYLPVLKLDVNSEVIIRNMVAYEAAIVLDSLVFARFIELINGIIKTAQDAGLLREKGIIWNSLKSDEDVAELFSGPSKLVRLSHSGSINDAIKEVKLYYYSRGRVRVRIFLKKQVYENWRFLSLVGSLFVFFLTAIQSVCSVYECSHSRNMKI